VNYVTQQTPVTDISYASLHLPEPLFRGIADAGFERCTPIQAGTLPRALAGLDVAGQAQTGTGKTAAFLVAMFAQLLRNPPPADRPLTSPRGFILAPTRELAVQIHRDAELLGQYTGLTLGLAFGGVDYEKQRRQLESGVDILIGTPGRIIDFYKQHVFDLKHVRVMVLDEADRMFDLGFIADIRYLMRRLPEPAARLSMLFSATLSQRVLELAYEHMNDPELIRIEPDKVTADRVSQVIYYPAMEEKARLLVGLLRKHEVLRSIVFVNMKRTAERLEATLKANDIHAEAMSGDVPQNKRLRMLRDFHDGRLPVLIATDVAARGLHIPDVSHVFNFDLPQDPEDYVHRIGRTARAGATGAAISFGCEDYVQSLPDIEAYIGSKIPVESVDSTLLPDIVRPAYHSQSHGGGDRGGRGRGGPGGRRDGGPRGGRRDSGQSDGQSKDNAQTATADGRPAGTSGARGPQGPRRDRGPRRPDGAARDTATPVAAVPAENVPATGDEVQKKRRRRRRRGGKGRQPEVGAAQGTTSSTVTRWTVIGAVVAGAAALAAWLALH
jgi:ATP-dependent RNA helicase RhlB